MKEEKEEGGNGDAEENEESGEENENFQIPKQLIQNYVVVEMKKKLVGLASFIRLQSFIKFVILFQS